MRKLNEIFLLHKNSAKMDLPNVAEFRTKVAFPLRYSITTPSANKKQEVDILLKQMNQAYQRYEPNIKN